MQSIATKTGILNPQNKIEFDKNSCYLSSAKMIPMLTKTTCTRLPLRQVGGSGLGLAICKEMVRAHRGTIWLDSVPGQGNTFTFTFTLLIKRAWSRYEYWIDTSR